MASRRCKNWLQTLAKYVEETETPRHFWIWGGIFCISAALQRKVWLPFGMDNLYPNLYVMLVATPGWCRKASPVVFAKKILMDIEIPVGIDSPTKRHFTQRLAELSKTQHFLYREVTKSQAPLALVSKELSSFLAVDPKNMVEVLTDLYDTHDVWDYGTASAGEDFLRNLYVSCFFATTPGWMAKNLPEEAIGGGFTSRFVLVSGIERYKELSLPPTPPKELYRDLKIDLAKISRIVGEVKWTPEAFEFYDNWYKTILPWARDVGDDRLFPSFSRVHTMAIKTAIILRVAEEDSLIIQKQNIEGAIKLLTSVFNTASEAFSAHGRSRTAVETDRLKGQLKILKMVTFRKLLKMNYRNTNKMELNEILENLEAMGLIKIERVAETNSQIINWVGK